MSGSVPTGCAPILEDWTARFIRLWKVKHMSYLTTVRTQQPQGLNIAPLMVAAILGSTTSRNLYSWTNLFQGFGQSPHTDVTTYTTCIRFSREYNTE
jgi:hypothetical protein